MEVVQLRRVGEVAAAAAAKAEARERGDFAKRAAPDSTATDFARAVASRLRFPKPRYARFFP